MDKDGQTANVLRARAMTDIDWELLFRYLGNECTADERARFSAWLAADPIHRGLLDAIATAAGRSLDAMPAPAPRPRMRFVAAQQTNPARVSRLSLALAASLTIAVGSTLIWRTLAVPNGAVGAAAPPLQTAATHRGERATLHLSDGTLVVLGAESTLRYLDSFEDGPREVFLEGDGYFEVTHDVQHPFRVHAGNATAEDLGTAFGVHAYAGDSTVRVVVAEGEVAFGSAAADAPRGAVLVRGQLGRLARGATQASVQQVNVDAYLGWTKGRLVFDDTPLDEVMAQLGRWYAGTFRLADPSLANRRLTGSFMSESLPEVLDILGPTLDIEFERRGDTVVAHPR